MAEEEYARLRELYSEISYIDQAINHLSWDQETFMPPGAILDRAGQMSVLSAIHHRKVTDPEIGRLVSVLEKSELGEEVSAVVREIGRAYRRQTSIPEDLVKEIASTQSVAQQAWQNARKKDDFSMFSPYLVKMVELKKREAECVGYDDVIYDALLDVYEPYARSSEITELFSSLRSRLVDIVKKITESGIVIDETVVRREYPIEDQKAFCDHLAKVLGFDFDKGRLDISAHPFTSGTRRDVRMTTRFEIDNLKNSVFSTIHETGHALYEQGYLENNYLTPLAEGVSLGIHESQSRFWENIIGRSRPFWSHMLPELKRHFPNMNDVTLDQMFRAVNTVGPSLIRTESDEVTYNLHIMIRYEMETGIMEGKIGVDEIPELWNDKYEEYLGIRPPTNADGCLQDIHWSMGLFGYFPTYTLGNLYSAQIYNAILRDMPDLGSRVASAEFAPILSWLRERIHSKGKLYPPKVLIEKATGSAPDADHFIRYLKEKFSGIYGITL
ncbi:MAG: carboxypeptidase M32 [Candidatus Thermoplasmatota archaeon]|nr:carboxypeptidase M32 [Candidatus Thermoplasmatota archaeon]